MKKVLFIVFILALEFFPQGKTFFDSPFALGGGYLPGWIMPDLNALNDNITGFGAPKLPKNGFFASGGAGFVYVPNVPNLRVGGMGFGGSTKSGIWAKGYDNEVEYTTGFGGLTVEYTLPFWHTPAISLGAIIGGGSTEIIISRHQGTLPWNYIWAEISDSLKTTANYSRTLKNSYFAFAPTVNIDIPLYRLVDFRVGAGYTFAVGSKWTLDNNINLDDVPKKLNGGGLFITTGIFLGFFSF
jgi:hypothetical protein